MNKQKVCMTGAVILALVFTLLLTGTRVREVEAKVHKTQEALAEEVFRFHVTANSDDPEDQELKLKVRDAVIARMKTEMGEAPERSAGATRRWALEHLDEIEETARNVIRKEGFRYDARGRGDPVLFSGQALRRSPISCRNLSGAEDQPGKRRRAELVVRSLPGSLLYGSGVRGGG